jgi:ubiquinone/menaquinone biosynthesis C-methylase UbiE
MEEAVAIQREYYRRTAAEYDGCHVTAPGEHEFALAFMLSTIGFLGIKSVLDIGSGTGRALLQIKQAYPELRVVGIEPSEALREVGYGKGVPRDVLIDGDGLALPFANGEFDLVCEFGVLHHVPDPKKAVAEMLRVAGRGVFLSDSNNYGQGGAASRALKQVLHSLGLWKAMDLVRTRGKGYHISESDGLFYSYSVFDNYDQIASACGRVHVLNTTPAGTNPYRSASHVALLGIR